MSKISVKAAAGMKFAPPGVKDANGRQVLISGDESAEVDEADPIVGRALHDGDIVRDTGLADRLAARGEVTTRGASDVELSTKKGT